MRAPAFWWTAPGPAAAALAPIGWAVGAVAARRLAAPPRERLAIPVVCIGNPTVGGAGKTPVAIAVARTLAEVGRSPVFLTRGYGGSMRGPVLVAGHDASEVGDEAVLLAAAAPTVVSADRAAGGRLASRHGDVVVMDDGFQNPQLAKDWSALLIDATVGLGNRRVTPAGPLRAPLRAQAARADAVVVVEGDDPDRAPLPMLPLPTFRVHLRASCDVALEGQSVTAFAGIGRPDKFFASVAALGADVVATRAFADHQPYTERQAGALLASAGQPVTTRKDVVRLAAGGPLARRLAEVAAVVDVVAVLDPALVEAVRRVVERRLSGRGG
ncbi:tetraacyldisaccharide 4'-kinase [Acuticoccus sp.]|uniref:tetraacyldisaccharide 4'-kinase n=1 Tax=Acuticoccus sp. TaxID=1904378 RepID=UPI003B5233AC